MQKSTSDGGTFKDGLLEVRYEYSPRLPVILQQLNATLLVTTYQAGKLMVLGTHGGQLHISFLDYDQPMGLAVSPLRIALGSRRQIHFFVPAHETQSRQQFHDGCFVPRSAFYTGTIHGHELGWGRDGCWIVNTLFSCLSTLHDDYSFVPRWRPPFVTELIDQDRCHLNGLALEDGRPKYVTAMGQTDSAQGWRLNKATGGSVLEVPSGQVICDNLAMPHSPRLHGGQLWVLDSGHGTLNRLDVSSGKHEIVERLPGYTRGLSFCGQFAFVGLSKIRETSVFGGIPIADRRDELRCGIGVVELISGNTVAVFQFHSGVSEIFAVEVLAGFSNPLFAGASVNQQDQEVWIVPNPSSSLPQIEKRLPLFYGRTFSELPPESGAFDSLSLQTSTIHDSTHSAATLVERGNLLQEQGNQHGAALLYERALETDSCCTAALQNLGFLRFNMGEVERAHDIFERLMALKPSTLNRLLAASVLPVIYDSQEDIEYWHRRQMDLLTATVTGCEPLDATQSLVPTCFFAAYKGVCDRALMELRDKCIRGRDFTANRKRPSRQDGRLRLGVVSAYFRDHTIGRLNIGRLEHLDREKIHLTVIYAGLQRDEMNARFEATADEYIRLPRELSAAIEILLHTDLDILLYTDVGMDPLTQTLAYSRFAPLQVATWGHPSTTGSSMIDYFVTSENLEDVTSETHYTEKLLYLNNLGLDYERPQFHAATDVRSQLGLPADVRLYGCPQTLYKFHPQFDAILARILEEDPTSELVLIEGRVAEWTHRLRRRFRRTLPCGGRQVRFLAPLPRQDFMSLLATVDVLLDPPFFGGGNSSIEAVAVGTPVVTMEGPFLRSRITSALYRELHLEDLIAADDKAYCQQATRIARDFDYQAELRERILAAAGKWFVLTEGSRQFAAGLLEMVSESK